MDRERTREAIKVMQHWVDGGCVEGRRLDNCGPPWGECPRPVWDWRAYEYRIRPDEPDESDIGKMVKVTDHQHDSCWMRRKLVALIKHEWKYICEDQLGATVGWRYARRIKEQS